MSHRLMNFAAIPKTHFNLGRVYVDIDTRRVHLQIQRINRLAVTVQHVFIGAAGDQFLRCAGDKRGRVTLRHDISDH